MIVILSYYGLLRCSDAHELRGKNFKFYKSGVVLRSNKRKNDRFGTRPLVAVIAKREDRICPVSLLKLAFTKLKCTKDQYLFCRMAVFIVICRIARTNIV